MTAAAGRREERPMGVLERRLRRLEKQWLPPAETEASRRWRSLFSKLPVGRSTSGGSIVSVSAAGCQKGSRARANKLANESNIDFMEFAIRCVNRRQTATAVGWRNSQMRTVIGRLRPSGPPAARR